MKLNKKNLISNFIDRIDHDKNDESVLMKKLTLLFTNPNVQEIVFLLLIGYCVFTWILVKQVLLAPSVEGVLIAIGLIAVVIVWAFLLFTSRRGDWFSHLFFIEKKSDSLIVSYTKII